MMLLLLWDHTSTATSQQQQHPYAQMAGCTRLALGQRVDATAMGAWMPAG